VKTRIALLGLTFLLQIADLWSTGSDVRIEGNPFMAALWTSAGYIPLVALKMGVALCLVVAYLLLAICAPRYGKLYLLSLTICNVAMIGVVVRNVFVQWLYF